MTHPEFIGKEGFGIPASIFAGDSYVDKPIIGASGHAYLVTTRPDFVRILDTQERRLHFFAEVMGGVLRLDIQSYLVRDDHRIQSPRMESSCRCIV